MNASTRRNNLNVLFYIKRQKLLKNGEAPICMRITVNGSYVEIMIRRSIPVSLWNQSKECSKGKDRNASELNYYINSIRSRIMQIHQELNIEGKIVTATTIRDKFNGKDDGSHTLLNIHEDHNSKCRNLIGKEFSELTIKKFETSIRRISDFLYTRYHVKDISLNDINGEFIREYEHWLKSTMNCKNNSALKYLKILKKVIRIALANEWIKKDPFLGIKFRYDEVDIEFLSREELDTLMNKHFSVKRLEQVRDIFVFSIFTGLAYIDVANLTGKNIVTLDGKQWIMTRRQKTDVPTNVLLLDIPRMIIEKYKLMMTDDDKGRLLPILSNQKMNAYLKEIADICGIEKRLSFHLARHTFATMALTKGVSIESVSKMLGHTNIQTTQIYARIINKKVEADMLSLSTKLDFSTAAI